MYFLQLTLLLATILIQKECFAGDGSLELQDGPNQITEYYVKDQCMAHPGYFHLHHFSLAFYLKEYQICEAGPHGMDGLLICYRSQLEKSELLPMGMQPTRQFELRNVAGNGVAKQCQEVGGPNWHGMLINKNEKRNWVLRFSTTNRTFIIEEEKLEELIYKLASAKDVGESFLSKTFGPYRDFMKWNNDHFGIAEEIKNKIRHMDNEKLKMLFMERQAIEERLQNYAGIWSLGLDMLPSKNDIGHFDLFVRKSECCQSIQAFFNQPTAQMPNTKMAEIKGEQIEYVTNIFVNFTVILDGIIKSGANFFIFEIVDQFGPKNNCQGMRFKVDFGKNSIIFQQKNDTEWITIPNAANEMQTISNHFVRGNPFHLVVILNKNGMTLNVNCNGQVPMILNAGTEIAFENPRVIKFLVTGDYKYWNDNFKNLSKSWMIKDEGLRGKNSNALMFQVKIDHNARKFSIKLWGRFANGTYNLILEFEVDIESHSYKIVTEGSHRVGKHSFNAGSEFKAVIKYLDDYSVLICMDNKGIADVNIGLPAEDLRNIIRFVHIVGDATAIMDIIPNDSFNADSCKLKKNKLII